MAKNSIPFPEIVIDIKYKGASKSELRTVTSQNDAADIFRQMMSENGMIHFREEMIILCLNQGSKCIGYYKLSAGGMTGTVADVRIIALIAIKSLANQIIVAHNHPSGNITPSGADIAFTAKLQAGLELLDIKLLDHLIITDEKHLSMAEQGHM